MLFDTVVLLPFMEEIKLQGHPILNNVKVFVISSNKYQIILLNKKIKFIKFRNLLRHLKISNFFFEISRLISILIYFFNISVFYKIDAKSQNTVFLPNLSHQYRTVQYFTVPHYTVCETVYYTVLIVYYTVLVQLIVLKKNTIVT